MKGAIVNEAAATQKLKTHSPQRLLVIFQLRNYRLYFTGQVISLTGSWMTQTAIIWLVYELTKSPWKVGLVGFCGQIPTLLLSALAGVWVDRVDRLKLLVTTQLVALIHALILTFLAFGGMLTFNLLALMAILQGIIQAFDLPGRQVLSVMLAERREHLPAIISVNSSLVNIGRMVGPSLAGFVIAVWGASYCFLFNAITYLVVIRAILAMRLPLYYPRKNSGSLWSELIEGFEYVVNYRALFLLILMSCVSAVFGLAVFTLMPSFTHEVFKADGRTLGFLMAAFSAGATLSGFGLACRDGVSGMNRIIALGMSMAGIAFLFFAFSNWLPLSLGALFVMGVGLVMVVATSNTLVQHKVEEEKRGRVMSIYGMAFMGGMPVGALLTGFLAQNIGILWSAALNGAVCLLFGTYYFWKYPLLPQGSGKGRIEIRIVAISPGQDA